MENLRRMELKAWKCPRCGEVTTGFPALSRTDNATDVCSQCGVDEAMEQFAGHLTPKVEWRGY